ncbi:MAG: hypothetical protein N2712_08125, partial [Brevinematales bacterium]|nr:hypothetical protein [Brevinematales bacterium]
VLYLDIKKLLHYAISLDNIEFVVYIIDNLYIEVDRELLIYYRKKIKETTKGMEQYLKKLESKIYQYSNCTEGFIHQGIFKDDIELLDTLYDLGLIYNDYKHIITIEMAVKEIRNNHKNEILEMIIKNSKDKLNLDKYIQEKLMNHLINRKLLESLKLSIKKELIQKQVLQKNI